MFNNKKTVFLYSEEQKHFLIVFFTVFIWLFLKIVFMNMKNGLK